MGDDTSMNFLRDRVKAVVYGTMIGDSLAMPVHWYYNPRDIKRDYGRVTDFQAPKAKHPSSIMNLSNTGGGGRGSSEGSIIGDVINHGKKKYWGKGRSVHYHQGMRAGDNTLNAICARLMARTLVAAEKVTPVTGTNGEIACTPAFFLKEYIAFMRTPGSHDDTYADTWHRMFFKNLVERDLPPEQCADNDHHNTDSLGGFGLLSPVIAITTASIGSAAGTEEGQRLIAKNTLDQMFSTHASPELAKYARVYARLLSSLLIGADLRESVLVAAKSVGADVKKVADAVGKDGDDTRAVGNYWSPACYVTDSFPATLYFAYKYADNPEQALIANTNVGGDNVNRGATLGAIMGAAHGMRAFPDKWVQGLGARKLIEVEATALAALASEKSKAYRGGDLGPQAEKTCSNM